MKKNKPKKEKNVRKRKECKKDKRKNIEKEHSLTPHWCRKKVSNSHPI
jgi:hypothetical protein